MWLLLVSSVVLYVISRFNYLLFHSLVESFAIIVAALIYVLATRTYQHSRNSMFLFLGIAFFHIAVLDFAHLLTYKGMGVFPGFGSDTPTQLWIAGRFLEAATFLIAVLFLWQKQIDRWFVTAAYSLVTAGLLLSIMVFRVFPVCFVEGAGLTTFKVAGEYVIACLLLAGAYRIYRRKIYAGQDVFRTIGIAMIITAASELTFTLYTDVYGIANMLGHLLKIASYYFIYSGVAALGIDTPYSLMSAELKERAIKDELTDLYNRQGLIGLMEKELRQVGQKSRALGILMMDLDNFKLINDGYGHLYGDKVLKDFAAVLKSSIRENDVAFRFGGDEFVVLVRGVDLHGLTHVQQRIQNAAGAWIAGNEKLKNLGVSIGSALLHPGQTYDVDSLLKMADQSMYAVKQSRKGVQVVKT